MLDFVPDMAAKRAELSPNRIAFIDAQTHRTHTFAEINLVANSLANSFDEIGLVKGNRITILCKNNVEFFIALFACQKTGTILAPLNWRQPFAELEPIISSLGTHAIIFDLDNQEVGQKLSLSNELVSISVGTASGADHKFNDLTERSKKRAFSQIDASEPWYLLFTSGTTGTPKAVIQTARMAWANAINIGMAIDLCGDDVGINYLPLFHTAGINLYTLPLFLNGGQSLLMSQFDVERIVSLITTKQITQFFGVPAIFQEIRSHQAFEKMSFEGIRFGCGGAAIAVDLVSEFARRGARICNGFGMTETGPTAFFMDEEHVETKIGSVGKVQSLTLSRIEGVEDGAEGVGEIQFSGPAITPGYFHSPEATDAAFTDDGWLKTGDVGRRDEDGYVYVVDRIKDMYISGGENVYPAEVEKVLITHPHIQEAAVVGNIDEKWGEVGAAYLLAKPDENIDITTLNAWCRERLAAYKTPKTFRVVADFPRTAAGKIRKPHLKELYKNAKI